MCQNLKTPNYDFEALLVAIEDLRKELNTQADQRRCFLLHPECLELSQELDVLLNKYYLLTMDSDSKSDSKIGSKNQGKPGGFYQDKSHLN